MEGDGRLASLGPDHTRRREPRSRLYPLLWPRQHRLSVSANVVLLPAPDRLT
jgi:hypothetical protein